MLKVGMIIRGFHSWDGGMEFLKAYVPALIKIESVELCCIINDRYLSIARVCEFREWLLHDFPQVSQIVCGDNWLALADCVCKEHIDVIFPSIEQLGEDFPVPWVQYVHDFQHKYLPELFSEEEIKDRDSDFFQKLTIPHAVIVEAEDVKKDIYKFFPQARCNVFVMPYTATPLVSWLNLDDVNLTSYALPKKYFLISNQFWMHKKHLIAFEALAKLLENGEEKCDIVCTGAMDDYRNKDYFKQLQEQIDEMGIGEHIHFLGFIPKRDQIKIMCKSVSVIQPTAFEGNPGGGIAYNALAMDVPIILSDIAVNKELKGEHISFFQVNNSDSLMEQMKIAIRNARRERIVDKKKLLVVGELRLDALSKALERVLQYSISDECKGYTPR